jgi:hypothetical protein
MMNEFQDVADLSQRLLEENSEWIGRFKDYAGEIQANLQFIKKHRIAFHALSPMKVYLTSTNARQASKTHLTLSLRYLGHKVADLTVAKKLTINTSKYDVNNALCFGSHIKLKNADWRSAEARNFRKHFLTYPSISAACPSREDEHRYESRLLTEFEKSTDKALPNIQPVEIKGIRFPMPTPLRACDQPIVEYAKNFIGGNIDIFCRTGLGTGNKLCVFELKDENKKGSKEPPRKVVKQAIAYATFIVNLLRSESGLDWWHILRESDRSKKVPDRLVIHAACLMPSNCNEYHSFDGITVNVGKDRILLNSVYFSGPDESITFSPTTLC